MKICQKISLNYHQISSNTHLISSAGFDKVFQFLLISILIVLSFIYAISFN